MNRLVANGVVAGPSLAVLIVVGGCAAPPTDDPDRRTRAISGGQVETGYPAVGCLQNFNPVGLCTGTLIAPNLVLSAKHCGPMTTFNTGTVCTFGGLQNRNIDYSIAYHPEEGTGKTTGYYEWDLVVHHLQTPIYDVRPLQINPLGYPANGTNCVEVGFGNDSAGFNGTKRSGSVVVQESGGDISNHKSAIRVSQASGLASPPGGTPQSGDSGAPLLCNGTGVIQGVHSGKDGSDIFSTGVESTETWSAEWITNVAVDYVNEPMVSVTSWGPNRFDLFARGTDGAIYQKTAENNQWYPSTFGWNYLGGFLTGTPEAVAWGSGRVDIFMRGGDPNPQTDAFSSMVLHHLYWNGSSWNWQQISSVGLASHPVAVSWGANRLDVFALTSTGYIGHFYSSNGVNWTTELIPTDGGPTTFLPLMKAISTSSGTLDSTRSAPTACPITAATTASVSGRNGTTSAAG